MDRRPERAAARPPEDAGATWELQCSLHDWLALRTRLAYVYDALVGNTRATGVYERHGEYSAWLVRTGWARVVVDDAPPVIAHAGNWLIVTGRHVEQSFSDDAHLLSLRAQAGWSDDRRLLLAPTPVMCLRAADHPQLTEAATRLRDRVQLVWRMQEHPAFAFQWRTRLDYAQFIQYQADLWHWHATLADVLRHENVALNLPRGVDASLAAALEFIDTCDFRKPFDERVLAEHAQRPFRQINRACSRTYDVTLHGYWEQRRLDRARFLIELGDRRVKQIAYELGFLQLSHFSAWFKRGVGVSPRMYRATSHER